MIKVRQVLRSLKQHVCGQCTGEIPIGDPHVYVFDMRSKGSVRLHGTCAVNRGNEQVAKVGRQVLQYIEDHYPLFTEVDAQLLQEIAEGAVINSYPAGATRHSIRSIMVRIMQQIERDKRHV